MPLAEEGLDLLWRELIECELAGHGVDVVADEAGVVRGDAALEAGSGGAEPWREEVVHRHPADRRRPAPVHGAPQFGEQAGNLTLRVVAEMAISVTSCPY
jgi:hypothetical protein